MKIIVAKNSGFCFGVKRAMNIVKEVKNNYSDKNIFTLGPIIHNPQVVNSLVEEKVFPVEDLKSLKKDDVLILRTHGIEKEMLSTIKKKRIKYIDATCPFVSNAHKYVKMLYRKGYQVIIFGEKNHPEILSINSQIDRKGIVIEDKDQIKDLIGLKNKKIGIISQTTQSIEKYKEIVTSLMDLFKEIYVINTICNATSLRQNSALALAKKVDLMLVVGGKNSGNTKRLFQICSELNEKTYHIETANEIDDFKDKILTNEVIGIVAGASTPNWIIKDVIEKLKKIDKEENKNGRKN